MLEGKENKLLLEVKKETGVDIEPWTATSLAQAFDKLDLTYERTAKSDAPSFTKHFLKTHKHPIASNWKKKNTFILVSKNLYAVIATNLCAEAVSMA